MPHEPVSGWLTVRAYPNPSRMALALQFTLSERGDFAVRIFDVNGRRVASIAAASLGAGRQSLRWDRVGRDGRAALPGIYHYELLASGRRATGRFVLLR